MLSLTTLPELLLLTILLKQKPVEFARLFRSNKFLKGFIKSHKKKFGIKHEGNVSIACKDGALSDLEVCSNTFTYRFREFDKNVLNTFGYFKFTQLMLESDSNKIVAERLPIRAESVISCWDEHTSEMLQVCKPKMVVLNSKPYESEVIELDLQLLGELQLDNLTFCSYWEEEIERVKYLLAHCSNFTKKLHISLSGDRYPSYKQEVIDLMNRVLCGDVERLQHLCVSGGADFPQNIGDSFATAADHPEHHLKLWTVPQRSGMIFCVEKKDQGGEFQLNVFFVADVRAMQELYDHSHEDNSMHVFVDIFKLWNLAKQENIGDDVQ